MIERDHLQAYTLTLTTQGPLYIGSGKKLPRKEYIFNARKKTVAFLNEQAFFDLLIQNNLVEQFESYCLRPDNDLYTFLYGKCGLTEAQVRPAILYEVNVGEAMDTEHTLKDIDCFMRNVRQQAYVPGSSVKGAIRTALLFGMLQREQKTYMEFPGQGTKRGVYFPETRYIHTLGLNDKPEDAVNSIMRGVQISDSQPIGDGSMMLALKTDSAVDGQTHTINLCRECVAPGTSISFQLTLDQSILKGKITKQTILDAISAFAAYQNKTYLQHFQQPWGAMPPTGRNVLTLGGGAGFFSKSLAYPYLGEERGRAWTIEHLSRAFRAHHHEKDNVLGISPRTLKYGVYRQKLYALGACEVTIQ